MLYLGLIPGDYIGWGICSKYLIQEVGKLVETAVLDARTVEAYRGRILEGNVFHTIGDHHLQKVMDVTGKKNYGYTFFENHLPDAAAENARQFDLILAGSSWCRERLAERGITWSDVLIQGIDPTLFYPLLNGKPGANDYFVVFSGGKFEFRKGQDLAIAAVKNLQQRHRDVLFVACWHNSWPFSMNTMAASPYIRFQSREKWDPAYMRRLLHESGIDVNRTEILPPIPHAQLRKIYACTDVGLFPNRCEGGTNLVLMEYMACAKPVIATFTSGHKDILNGQNSLMLTRLRPLDRKRAEAGCMWEEPDLDEAVEMLEYAYQHPGEIASLGKKAGEDLQGRTWQASARELVSKLGLSTTGGAC